ncbi:NAD(P)/FAD-dependent oxidoreductase [Haloglycomyces albus]|uniref:NAD(P)/FAD-dependent oxidoreductase n=1 Tax=Haloglycomyces albus TaxID=526067 RepID=UPI00046D3FD8|nr:FAD-dependent oxidoreductase [Haloglycomyces albus]
MDIIIVGGGILGTMHAWEAIDHGHNVIHIEREHESRGASVRGFGLVWTTSRVNDQEDRAGMRSRELWEKIAQLADGLSFRSCGSMTIARTEIDLEVAAEVAADPDIGGRFELLEPTEARRINPLLQGSFQAGLWCPSDAVVEPRQLLPALRAYMGATGRYRWFSDREVRDVGTGWVYDDRGRRYEGDCVVLATGAWHSGLLRELAGELPLRRVRMEMVQTRPLMDKVPTAVATVESMRHLTVDSPAIIQSPGSDSPEPLLLVQRSDGSLTIGNVREDHEPFGFDITDDIYARLLRDAEALFGRSLPTVRRSWAGVYSQRVDPGPKELLYRNQVMEGVWLLTGLGERGMTTAPYFASQTALDLNW